MTELALKRAYDPSSPEDGYRVYIDRLWPRGLSHETFKYDVWDKNISPSTDLREWFHADPDNRWDGFVSKYEAELKENPDFANMVSDLEKHSKVTLLFSSRDRLHDNAVVVYDYILKELPGKFKGESDVNE